MNLNTLQYALILAEEKNMTKAAKRLYISQPSLSQSICRLENEIGLTLFFREKNGIKPSPAGILFLEWAEKVMNTHKNMIDKFNAVKKGQMPSIKIGTTPFRANYLLTEIFPLFLNLYPECRIELEEYPSPALDSLLQNKTIDLCITTDKLNHIDYTSIPICHEQILLLVPEHIKITSTDTKPYPTISEQDLDNIPFVILSEDLYLGKLARRLFLQLNHEPYIIMQCRNLETALRMVLKGTAATLLPVITQTAPAGVRYYQIDHPAMTREIYFVYRKEHYLTVEENGFLNLCYKYIQ